MIVALILIAFGFAVYADRIDDQRRCEDTMRTESAEPPTRAEYRRRCTGQAE